MRKKLGARRQQKSAARPRSTEPRLAAAAKPVAKSAPLAAPKTAPVAVEVSGKIRCKGATRYGDPCRFWAAPGSEFCYWCDQAGRPRFPLPKPTGEAARVAGIKEIHKRRCQGVTVFGDQCRFWAVGTTNYCLWCSGSQTSPAADPAADTDKPSQPA